MNCKHERVDHSVSFSRRPIETKPIDDTRSFFLGPLEIKAQGKCKDCGMVDFYDGKGWQPALMIRKDAFQLLAQGFASIRSLEDRNRRKQQRLDGLSIDPQGFWSSRQAQKVLEIILPEAALMNLSFGIIDVTTFSMPAARFLLTLKCLKHDRPIAWDEYCPRCVDDL